jgi:selenocysteine lyase/cysteine desulfurase
MKLQSQRHLFDIPDDVTYLNCAYMSPLMHRVREAAIEGLTRKCRPWEISARDFFTGSDALRAAFAELVHARPEDVAIVPAASYGVSTAAKNLPLERGEAVLVVEDQFPSNVYPWRERAREVGGSVRTVARPEDGDWTSAVLAALDERVRVVALPHCHWTDGGLFDLERISDACRESGAALSLDVTQSLGALPFDVRRVKPDFLTAATYKWLMGPYSLGLLYVSERWQREGKPLEHNWIHRKNSENFARLVDYQDEFAPGSERFDVGERSNFALVPAAEAGIRQILEWGVENVAETLSSLTESIAARAGKLGLSALPRDLSAPHYLGLRLGPDVPADVLARLAERKVYVSVRGSSMRVTPHLYNNDGDVERFLRALESVLG